MVDAPVVHHANAFWLDPASHRQQVPRLAVLLLNAKHCSWHVKPQVTAHTRNHATELFWNCWSNAHVTVCADGGANRLYDRSVQVDAEALVQPQYIKGDLDSLRDDVRAFYEAKGTKIIHDPDQNSNDLDKCLQLVHDLQEADGTASTKFTVLIFGAMGGRFDQEMQNINALFRWSGHFERITLLSEDTTTTLLQPGKRYVLTPNFHFETRTCGLIPVGATCESITTKGLKWDMQEQRTEFGGLVSSSNHIEGDSVEVWNSHAVIWTTELKK
ncbi:TPA: hypothetical protein N0F65_008791 [Lagenidium giganteum]|uniref:Thiamine pyrophosphokinase n=1 Tax=Lagenidium giganteum TaxID=4803 RepID=A0AAV2YXB5_9STRA|nr:TPA: hypothetical protein N0F65_008791 [Lagenidium giganteum]